MYIYRSRYEQDCPSTVAPILQHFNLDKEVVFKTDASNYVLVGILLQHNNNDILYLVAYFFMKYLPAEYNYEIYNQELIAIVRCFEE